jgi:hypothetical protein
MLPAAFASEIETQFRARDIDVTISKCCQAIGIILPGVLFIADADQCSFQQSHDRGEYFFFRQTFPREIAFDTRANLRQDFAEVGQTIEFCLVTHLTPSRMISILLAASRIAADRLQVAFVDGTYPDIGPSRRDRKRANSREGPRSPDQSSVRGKVSKSLAGAHAPNAWHAVGHIPQSGNLGRSDRICRSESHFKLDGTSKTSTDVLKNGGIMDILLMVAIVLIALAIVTQAGVLLAMYLMSRRMTTKAEALIHESQRLIAPLELIMSNLRTVSDDLTESGKIAREQVLNVQDTINETRDVIRGQMAEVREVVLDTADEARDLVLRPIRHISALAMGISVGIRTFLFGKRRTGDTEGERPAA